MANNEAQLREALQQTRQELAELQKVLESLGNPPVVHVPVLRVNKKDKTVTVFHQGAMTDVPILPELQGKVNVGDDMLVSTQAMVGLSVGEYLRQGATQTITKTIGAAEVEVAGNRVVAVAPAVAKKGLKEGDKAILDPNGVCVIGVLPAEKQAFEFVANTGVSWADIGGQEEAKRAMIEAVELPITNPEIFRFYNKKPASGVNLYGPPGTGKTMFGKAAATAVAKLAGKDRRAGFFYVKGPELLDPYVGVTEAQIRGLFDRARKHQAENGTKAVIFIDEADAILSARGMRGTSFMSQTIVPQFLSEMDGLETSAALVILATNRPDVLDPAVVREGRMDRKIAVTRPTPRDAVAILKLHLRGVPLAAGLEATEVADYVAEQVYDNEVRLYEVLTDDGGQTIRMSDIVSGALLAGVVHQAQSVAMQRDLDLGGLPQGVNLPDFEKAIRRILRENQDANHSETIMDKVGSAKVTGVRKVQYAEAA